MSARAPVLLCLGLFVACGGSTLSSSDDARDGGVGSVEAGSTAAADAGTSARVDAATLVVDAARVDASSVNVPDGTTCGSLCVMAHPQGESGALLGLYDCMTKTACKTKCAPALQRRDWTPECMRCVDAELQAGNCENHCGNDPECNGFQQCLLMCP